MELVDTVESMLSTDYKKRFESEYYQLSIRIDKLQRMYDNWDNLDFTPTCPKNLYKRQLDYMKQYLEILKIRSELEEIKLEDK